MGNEKHRKLYASLVAVLGGLFIFGITPHPALGISWHWPFRHEAVSSATHIATTEIQKDAVQKSQASKYVVVLMYHHVSDLTFEQRKSDPMLSDLTVSVADFEAQVKYFHDHGYKSITVADLYQSFQSGALPSKPVIFTFDDGYRDAFVNAVPLLEKYGYTGSFAVATELLGKPSYAIWEDVITAKSVGMEILSHTENHLDLTNPVYSDKDLKREIVDSKKVLETKLGTRIDFFVYPYGRTNEKVTRFVAQASYKMAFTTAYGTKMDPSDLLSEPRVRVHGVDGLEKLKKVLPK